MSEQLNDTLYNVGEDIFENLAFVLTMPEDDMFGDFGYGDFDNEDDDTEPNDESTEPKNEFEVTEETDETETFAGLDFDGDSEISEETITSSIHFRGEFEGDLFLEVSCELLPVIGMNMLGLDDENALTPDEQKDAFRELLNVVCGNLLPTVTDEKAVFDIDGAELHPEMAIPETHEGKPAIAKAHFGLEIGHAKLALFIDQEVWEKFQSSTPSCV
ncbi:MAG: chemotaxis protein CheX [Planctomycetia bacterium]|jgi:hypothetical protein